MIAVLLHLFAFLPTLIPRANAHHSHKNPDLRAPGADDNGSGSSNVLEIARVLSQSDVKYGLSHFCCSILIFSLFAGSSTLCAFACGQARNRASMAPVPMRLR